jgi:hypothetical protein
VNSAPRSGFGWQYSWAHSGRCCATEYAIDAVVRVDV